MSTNDEHTSKRQRLDLPVLTEAEQRVVLIQYKKDNAEDNAESILAEYLKFMYIKVREESDGECAQSKVIDAMWHAHILSTRQYSAFCHRSNDGEYIHHDPTMLAGQQRYALTLKRYNKFFGIDPSDRNIWPLSLSEHRGVKKEEQETEDEEEVEGGAGKT